MPLLYLNVDTDPIFYSQPREDTPPPLHLQPHYDHRHHIPRSFYGFMFSGGQNYLTKKIIVGMDRTFYLDLWENTAIVTDAAELRTYNTYLFEQRAEKVG